MRRAGFDIDHHKAEKENGLGEFVFGTVATQENGAMETGVNKLVLISVIPVIPVNPPRL